MWNQIAASLFQRSLFLVSKQCFWTSEQPLMRELSFSLKTSEDTDVCRPWWRPLIFFTLNELVHQKMTLCNLISRILFQTHMFFCVTQKKTFWWIALLFLSCNYNECGERCKSLKKECHKSIIKIIVISDAMITFPSNNLLNSATRSCVLDKPTEPTKPTMIQIQKCSDHSFSHEH